MNKVVLPFLIFLTCTTLSFADQVITLKDGSQIKGQVMGMENGVYTVKTPVIGEIKVSAADVANISSNSNTAQAAANSSPSSPISNQQIAAQQQQIMNNPQAMSDIQDLMKDPEIMKAMTDPTVVQAVTNHDYQSLENNPKMHELMDNPKMQAVLHKIAAQEHHSSE